MKFSAMMVVCAAALCVAGCKYKKINEGSGTDTGADVATGVGIEGLENGAAAGSLSGLSEGKFEDMYTRCTDVNFAPVYFGFDSTVVPQGELGKIDAVACA